MSSESKEAFAEQYETKYFEILERIPPISRIALIALNEQDLTRTQLMLIVSDILKRNKVVPRTTMFDNLVRNLELHYGVVERITKPTGRRGRPDTFFHLIYPISQKIKEKILSMKWCL